MRQPATEDRRPRGLIAGILLAAGQSTRFGRQKLLERWQGEPLVRRAARTFLEAGLAPVLVVVSPDPALGEALEGLAVQRVVNPQPERGISRSIALGLDALSHEVEAALIGVADQPRLDAGALRALCAALDGARIVAPRYGDHRGNPVIFDRSYFPELLALTGDRGGQQVVGRHGDAVIEVELDARIGEDVDRPDQWPA